VVSDFATRFCGSSDFTNGAAAAARQHQLHHLSRRLHAARLVSYNDKHNEATATRTATARLTTSVGIAAPRGDQRRGDQCPAGKKETQLPGHAAVFPGLPMLLSATKSAHANGNNNTYCQDNEITWSLGLTPEQQSLLKTVRQMIRIFHESRSSIAAVSFTAGIHGPRRRRSTGSILGQRDVERGMAGGVVAGWSEVSGGRSTSTSTAKRFSASRS